MKSASLNELEKFQLKGNRFVFDEVFRLHGNRMDFEEGDLRHRLDRFNDYVVKSIPISKIDLFEFSLDDDKVDEFIELYKKTGEYPPIVFDDVDGSVIDGLHRANALAKMGETHINAYVGTEEHADPNWDPLDADDDCDDDERYQPLRP